MPCVSFIMWWGLPFLQWFLAAGFRAWQMLWEMMVSQGDRLQS